MDSTAAMEHIVIAAKKAGPLPAAVTPQTRLLEDLGLDSTGLIEMLMDLEESAGFEADVDELEPGAFQTVGSLAEYVARMTDGRASVTDHGAADHGAADHEAADHEAASRGAASHGAS